MSPVSVIVAWLSALSPVQIAACGLVLILVLAVLLLAANDPRRRK